MEATTGGLIVFGTQSLSGRLWFSKNDAAVAVMDNLYFAPYANAGMDLGTNDFRWNRLFYTSGILGTSDKRLKNNIQPLHYGLSELMKLNPVRFSWNLFPEQGVQLGLIAQEVQHILPEVISIGTDSIKTLSLNHLQLIPVLIKATQELNTKVDKLESENVGLIHSFKEELAELKKRHETEIATLKKQMEQVLQHQSTQARRPE
jgi:exonuclease VII small subunit